MKHSLLCLAALALVGAAPPASPRTRQVEHVRKLVRQLDDNEFEVREKAEKALLALGKKALPQLKQELRAAKNLEPRMRLERIVTALNPVDPLQKRVRALVRELDNDDFDVRTRASLDLLAAGKPALPLMRQELAKARSLEVRRRLEVIISRLERK
jgi:hypothetical protein